MNRMEEMEALFEGVLEQKLENGKPAKPDTFRGKPGEDINTWIFKFNIAAKSNGWSEQKKMLKLPAFLSDAALDFYALVIMPDEMNYDSCEAVLSALKEKFLPSNYEHVLREELENLKQGSESVSAFLLTVMKKCKQVDEDMPEREMIRIMLKGMNPKISRPVYASTPETIADLEKAARGVEAGYMLYRETDAGATEMKQKVEQMNDKFDILLSKVENLQLAPYSARREGYARVPEQIRFAGGRGNPPNERRVHWGANRFPTTNDTRTLGGDPKCFECSRVGHIARNCPDAAERKARERNDVRLNERKSPDQTRFPSSRPLPRRNEQQTEFLRRFGRSEALFASTAELNEMLPFFNVTIRNNDLCFEESFASLVDTGTAVTVVSRKVADQLGYGAAGLPLTPSHIELRCGNMQIVSLYGTFPATIGFDPTLFEKESLTTYEYVVDQATITGERVFVDLTVLVADISFEIILGMDFIMSSGMTICHGPEGTTFGHVKLQPPKAEEVTGPLNWPAPHVFPPGSLTECRFTHFHQLVTKVKLATNEKEFFKINGMELNQEAVIDTGSVFTVIDKGIAEKISGEIQKFSSPKMISCTNGSPLRVYGRMHFVVLFQVCVIGDDSHQVAADLQSVTINALIVENYITGVTLGQSFLRSSGIWLHPLTGTMGTVADQKYDSSRLLTEMVILRHPWFRGPEAKKRKAEEYDLDEMTKLAISERGEAHQYAAATRESASFPVPLYLLEDENAEDLIKNESEFPPSPALESVTNDEKDSDADWISDPSNACSSRSALNMVIVSNQSPAPDFTPYSGHETSQEKQPEALQQSPDDYAKGFLRYYDNLIKSDHKHKSVIETNEQTFPMEFDGNELNVSQILTQAERLSLHRMLIVYRQCFSFPGEPLGQCFLYPCVIHTENEIPIRRMPFTQSLEKRDLMNKEVEEGLRLGIYRPSNSPYASNAHLVDKKLTVIKRLVIDFRPLNAITITDSYPLPSSKMMLSCLNGSKWFTLLDCARGFNQIAMHPDSIRKTAFVTHDGLFECPFMPMGIKNGPATYQRVIDCVLGGLKWQCCIVFMDDILIFSDTLENHMKDVVRVLDRISDSGLTLKPSKCFFCMPGVSFLGYYIDSEGIHMQSEKVESIVNFPDPTNLTEARSFKGLAGFYSHFIPKFSSIVKPITNLFRKDVPFQWGEAQRDAANLLKSMLLQYPVLVHFDPACRTELHCDASGLGLGAVVGQIMNDDKFHPVEFASRCLSQAESNYSATDKEALAIVWAVKKFTVYLEGRHFDVFTDHRALEWLQTKPQLPRRLMKFALELQNYDYSIHYKPGKTNNDADALSRFPVLPPEDTEEKLIITTMALFDEETPLTQLIREQEKDFHFGPILQDLRQGQHSRHKQYSLINDCLFRQKNRKTGPKNLLCIPMCMREDVMYAIHDDLFGCHAGVVKTLDRLRERFFFPGMEQFVRAYIQSCKSCLSRKKERQKPYGFLRPIEVGEPFDMIGLDIWGPATMTSNKKRYIIVASDYLTRYCEIAALTSVTSAQVAKFLIENVFKTHGFVSKILSDRGTNFLSEVMYDLYDQLSIEKINTTHYRPQTDGLVEAFNKTMGDMLSHYTSKDQKDWDRHLPLIQFAHNSSKSSATGFSPFFLVHGREPRIPIDITFEIPHSLLDNNDHLERVIDKLAVAREVARESIKRSQESSKRNYDKHRRPVNFQLGDQVMRYVPTQKLGLTNKLLHKFMGPYRISLDHGDNVFTLTPVSGRGKDVVVNAESLKHFHDRLLYSFSEDEDDDGDSSDSSMQVRCRSTSPVLPPAFVTAEHSVVSLDQHSSLDSCTIALPSSSSDQSFHSVHSAAGKEQPPPPPSSSDSTQSASGHSFGSDPTPPSLPKPPEPAVPAADSIKSQESSQAEAKKDSDPLPRHLFVPTIPTRAAQKPVAVVVDTGHAAAAVSALLPALPAHGEQPDIVQPDAQETGPSPLRRSKRITTRPIKYTQALFFPLALLSLIACSSASFTKVAPLVWRVTDRPVISGVTRVHSKIAYESPCIVFNVTDPTSRNRFGIGTQTNILLTRLHDWCEGEFEHSFVKPLESFCLSHDDGEKKLSRDKRVIAAAIAVTSVIVSVIATIGVAAISSSQAKQELVSIQEQQDVLLEQLETHKIMNDHVKDILTQLDQRTDVLSKAFKDAQERFASLMNFHVPSVTTVSKIGTSLAVVKERFFAIGVDWRRKILNPLFLNTLNITLRCTDDCPYRLMTPISCQVDTLRRQIRLSFEQRTTKSRTQVLVADPFRLITNVSTSSICFGSYRGPHSVIYDEKLDCVTPIRGDSDSNDNMILSPAVSYCSDAVRINESSEYWSRIECTPTSLVREDDIIQLKSSDQYTYIYCATLKISVFNRTFDCPNFVFSIPHFASFSIGKLDYRADNLQLSHTLKLAPVTSSRVNFHLLPTLPAFENDQRLNAEINALKSGIDIPERHFIIRHAEDNMVIYFIVLLLTAAGLMFLKYMQRRSKQLRRSRSKFSPRSERVALSDIEGNVSDDDDAAPSSTSDKKTRRATGSPKLATKHSALLCALSLIACTTISDACPELLSMEMDVSICRHINSSHQAACEITQAHVIENPLSSYCTGRRDQYQSHRNRYTRSLVETASKTPLFTLSKDISTLMSVVPLVELQISDILHDMRERRIHPSLFRISGIILPPDCSSESYLPLTCRFDNSTKFLFVTAFSSTRIPDITASIMRFFNRYSSLLSLLSFSLTAASFIYFFKILRSRSHSRLPLWKSEEDLPPHPLRHLKHART